MTTNQTVLQGKDTATQGRLYMSFELGDKSWKLTMSDGRRGPGRYNVDAGDSAAVLDCISKARARCGLSAEAKVHSCYEAGRDGWWLHRWLIERGIDNIVVDAASIEVNRRARRANTDRFDGDKPDALDWKQQKHSARKAIDRFRLELNTDYLDIVLMHNVVTPEWDNDLAGFKPTVVTLCYGMNDGQYRPYVDEIGRGYESAMRKVLTPIYPTLEGLKLVDYKVRILTPGDGTRAITRVMIESADGAGNHWSTVGVSANIIDASYNALRDSLVYLLYRDGAEEPDPS